jgi:HlyD family secretion protein
MNEQRATRRRIPPQVPIVIGLLALAAFSILRWQRDAAGDPDHLVVSGTIEGEDIAVGSKVGGRLLELHTQEGDAVAAGQLLALFDAAELEVQARQLDAAVAAAEAQRQKLVNGPRGTDLAQARAAVDTARAQLAELVAGSRTEDVAAAEANWRAAEAQYELAVADHERSEQLFASGVIPQSQIDAARTRMDTARRAADVARQQYDKAAAGPRATQIEVAERQVAQAEAAYQAIAAGSRAEDIAAAAAQVQSTQALRESVDVQLAETRITAPAAGTVLTVNRRPGDLLGPGEPVVTMILPETYYVQLFIPEEKLSWAAPGAAARIEVDAFPGETFSGNVTYLSPLGEFTPRNLQTKEKRVEQVFRCKLQVQNGAGKLRPGMVCDVTFERPASVKAQ